MQQVELSVVARQTGTKSSTKELRNKGLVPANIYGPGIKNETCAFMEKELRKVFNNDFDSNYILTLKSDASQLNGKRVIVKNIERDATTWRLNHTDFYEISFDRPLTVSVPLHFNGTPEGVKNSGGILQIIRRSVLINALPNDIPNTIEVDISKLELGQSLHIGEVQFTDKIKVMDSKGFALVSIVEAEKEEVAVPVAAAPAEGTATAAATGATAATPAAAGAAAPAAAAGVEKADAGAKAPKGKG